MNALASTPHVADGLLGHRTNSTGANAVDLLNAVIASRGIALPQDLVSAIGAGATTLWQLNAAQTLVVANITREAAIDDAYECGRIAATSALTAVHARAASPLFARLTLACPAGASDSARRHLVEGVAVAMAASGAVLADVQLVDAPVLRFDVLVAGIVRPDRVRGVAGAQPDDVLILASPLGTGIYAAAAMRGRLSDDDRRSLIDAATRPNAAGIALGTIRNVHAVAEVGPEGLIAAALAMAEAASLHATIETSRMPVLPRALSLAKSGAVAPLSSRNWNRDGARVALAEAVMPEMRSLLTDPQTSGALLIACKRDSVDRVLKLCGGEGESAGTRAAAIGVFASVASHDARRRLSIEA